MLAHPFKTRPYTDALDGFRPKEISQALGARATTLLLGLEREGFRIVYSEDFEDLLTLQQENADREFLPLFSPVHPVLSPHPDKFWLGVVARTGNIVATVAGVHAYIPADETLVDHLRSLRLLYADPLAAIAQGASAQSTSTMARTIQGRIQMMLGFWTDPDWRKRGLASRACHLAMMMGMAQRQPDWTIGFVDDSSSNRLTWRDRKKGQDGYLWRHREPEIEIRCPYIGTIVEDLVAMTRTQLEADIIGYRPDQRIAASALPFSVAAE